MRPHRNRLTLGQSPGKPSSTIQIDLLEIKPGRRSRFHYEEALQNQGYRFVAGVDEVGRGPLAGPVVAAAAILPLDFKHKWLLDSKVLSPEQRAEVAQCLRNHPEVIFAIAEASVEEIDALNILQASLLAMRRAVEALKQRPDYLLIDGRDCPKIAIPGKAIIQGDAKVPSIAAASILAKEHRDASMAAWAKTHPHYGFEIHKGYATKLHRDALAAHGPCPLHRRSFAPVRSADTSFF